MKKSVCIAAATALAFGLCLSAGAQSAGKSTTVSFSAAPSYTITIPAVVELVKTQGDNVTAYAKDMTVTADAGTFLHNGETVQVKIAGDFQMKTPEGAELPYTVKVGEGTTPVANNAVVASFGTKTTAQTATLHFAAGTPTYAGNYSDTLTFTMGIVTPQ